ncbi:hypothetical protein EV361DRAFT_185388, partial [Lentinula raphanica]
MRFHRHQPFFLFPLFHVVLVFTNLFSFSRSNFCWASNPSSLQDANISEPNAFLLQDEFRRHYHHFASVLTQISQDDTTDVFHLVNLGEDLEEYANLVSQNSAIFLDQSEWETLRTNVQSMILDLRTIYEQRLEQSHHGRPNVISWEHTGSAGRPRANIDPNFLQWAYGRRTTSGIADFLGVSRRTVRRALLDYDIASPGSAPFDVDSDVSSEDNQQGPETHPLVPENLPPAVQDAARSIQSSSSSSYLS